MSLIPEADQPPKDSKDNTERKCEVQQECEESPSAIVGNPNNGANDAPNSESNTTDKLKSPTLCNCNDGVDNGKNNSLDDGGSSSLLDSNGGNDFSLRPTNGIGLDCSPCEKRVAYSPAADAEDDLLKIHSTTAKKIRTPSLSGEDTKEKIGTGDAKDKIGTGFEHVTHHVHNVTQDDALEGLTSNETDEDDVKTEKGNVTQNETNELLFRKEFILGDTEYDTLLNSLDVAQEITVENNEEVPFSLLADEALVGELGAGNDTQTYEKSVKGKSYQIGK